MRADTNASAKRAELVPLVPTQPAPTIALAMELATVPLIGVFATRASWGSTVLLQCATVDWSSRRVSAAETDTARTMECANALMGGEETNALPEHASTHAATTEFAPLISNASATLPGQERTARKRLAPTHAQAVVFVSMMVPISDVCVILDMPDLIAAKNSVLMTVLRRIMDNASTEPATARTDLLVLTAPACPVAIAPVMDLAIPRQRNAHATRDTVAPFAKPRHAQDLLEELNAHIMDFALPELVCVMLAFRAQIARVTAPVVPDSSMIHHALVMASAR